MFWCFNSASTDPLDLDFFLHLLVFFGYVISRKTRCFHVVVFIVSVHMNYGSCTGKDFVTPCIQCRENKLLPCIQQPDMTQQRFDKERDMPRNWICSPAYKVDDSLPSPGIEDSLPASEVDDGLPATGCMLASPQPGSRVTGSRAQITPAASWLIR